MQTRARSGSSALLSGLIGLGFHLGASFMLSYAALLEKDDPADSEKAGKRIARPRPAGSKGICLQHCDAATQKDERNNSLA